VSIARISIVVGIASTHIRTQSPALPVALTLRQCLLSKAESDDPSNSPVNSVDILLCFILEIESFI
jgi:hypothetical protein